MKGISLAIETIIVIILAVTVLSVLLLFFTGTGGPAQNRVMAESQRTLMCGTYTSENPTCNPTATLTTPLPNLAKICKSVDVQSCQGTLASATDTGNCYKDCCATYCKSK